MNLRTYIICACSLFALTVPVRPAPDGPQSDYFTSEVYQQEDIDRPVRGSVRSRKEKIRQRIEKIEERKQRAARTTPAPSAPPILEPLEDLKSTPQPRPDLRGDLDLRLQGLFDAMNADKPGGRTRAHEAGYIRAKARGEIEYGPRYLARADLRATQYKSNYRRTALFRETWLEENRYDIWQLDGQENLTSNSMTTAGARELWAKYETRNFSFRAGRQQLDWSENRHFDPLNVVGRHTPFTLQPDELKGTDGFEFTGIINQRTAIDVVTAFHASGTHHGAGPNSLYQDAVLRLQSTVIDDLDLTLIGGWKARRSLGGLGLDGQAGALRYRVGAMFFSPFVRDPESADAFIENRFTFQTENRSFGQGSLGLEYEFSDAFVLGLAGFYNGGANRYRPSTFRGMERLSDINQFQGGPNPDRDVYDLQRGHINTYRATFSGLSFTGRPLRGFYYELYVYVDHDGRGVMASPLLSYEYGENLLLKLGGRVYSSVKDRQSDFSERDNHAYFMAEWRIL